MMHQAVKHTWFSNLNEFSVKLLDARVENYKACYVEGDDYCSVQEYKTSIQHKTTIKNFLQIGLYIVSDSITI